MTDRNPEVALPQMETSPAEQGNINEMVENILEEAQEIETASPAQAEIPSETVAEQPAHTRPPSTLQKMVAPRANVDDLTLSVEKIMEEDVGAAYNQLSPIAKQEFKLKGEQTARAIRSMMKSTTLKVKKVFQLILNWLKMLPGINKFFLEQEAKIKTDRIIMLHQEQKEKMYAA